MDNEKGANVVNIHCFIERSELLGFCSLPSETAEFNKLVYLADIGAPLRYLSDITEWRNKYDSLIFGLLFKAHIQPEGSTKKLNDFVNDLEKMFPESVSSKQLDVINGILSSLKLSEYENVRVLTNTDLLVRLLQREISTEEYREKATSLPGVFLYNGFETDAVTLPHYFAKTKN